MRFFLNSQWEIRTQSYAYGTHSYAIDTQMSPWDKLEMDYDPTARAPDFYRADQPLDILRRSLRRILHEYSMTEEFVAYMFRRFVRASPALKLRVGSIDQQSISRFLVAPWPEHPRRNVDFPVALWLWMATEPAFRRIRREEAARPKGATNPLLGALHVELSPSEPIDPKRFSQLKGRFAVYRRYFWHPESEVMISELRCGESDDPSSFTMLMKYVAGGQASADEVDGSMIPYGDGILFQGKFCVKRGPFVFVLRTPEIHSSDRIAGGTGVLLAAAVGQIPSAYPILVKRSDRPVKCTTCDIEAIKSNKDLWKLFRPVWGRGFTSWDGEP